MAQDKDLCVPTHNLILCVSTQRYQRVEVTRLAACVSDPEDHAVSVGCDPGTVFTLSMVTMGKAPAVSASAPLWLLHPEEAQPRCLGKITDTLYIA